MLEKNGTGGASPTTAVWLKKQVNSLLPDRFDAILAWLEGLRPALKAALPRETQRSRLFSHLFNACLDLGRPLTEEAAVPLGEGGVRL